MAPVGLDSLQVTHSDGGDVSEQDNRRSELNDAVEDATGFNFRSLRTISDLIFKPNRVFQAYAARDRATYTPALRLWMGIIGLQVLVSALWGGWAGVIRRQADANPAVRDLYAQASGGQLDEFFQHYGDAMGVAQPIIVGGMTALSVFVLGWFRKGLPWPSRLNIAMGVLSVGSVVGLMLMPVVVIPELMPWMGLSTLLIVLAYFLTFLRGAPGVLADTAGGAWIKAIIYSVVLILLIGLGGLLMTVITITYAVVRTTAA